MRLHQFILANMEAILREWEKFARRIWPGEEPSPRLLLDHAEEMLRAVVQDMQTPQSDSQQAEKSMGNGGDTCGSAAVDRSSARHAVSRAESGFDLRQLVAEYRALRASVVHQWSLQQDRDSAHELQDLTRFNEGVDQLLAESVVCYSEWMDHSREVFLGILGHDLRTPLHAVAMVADVLERRCQLSGTPLEMAHQISVSVREMERMIADLLDFTGTRLGAKMTILRMSMDLEELGREVIEELRAAHPSREFRLGIRGELAGEWDRPRVRQVLSNLLGNAVQHGAAMTPIALSLTAEEEAVVMEVRNQGTPIPSDALAWIFDPLRRNADEVLTRPAGSIGLGLFIAREVVSAHGGTISVTSDAAETVFRVKLPCGGARVAV